MGTNRIESIAFDRNPEGWKWSISFLNGSDGSNHRVEGSDPTYSAALAAFRGAIDKHHREINGGNDAERLIQWLRLNIQWYGEMKFKYLSTEDSEEFRQMCKDTEADLESVIQEIENALSK